jgi:hypothetical protein
LDGVYGVTLNDPGTAESFAGHHGSLHAHLSEVTAGISWSSAELGLLKKRLKKQRKVLARCWSDDTIYPGSKATNAPGQPPSHGQCGVTSAWLMRRLGEPWESMARYCVGDVLFGGADGERAVEKYHCWVEITDELSPTRLVIDLTCDQFQGLKDVSVLVEDHRSLMARSIEYRLGTSRRFEELSGDSVWARLKVLDQAISRTWRRTPRNFVCKTLQFVPRRRRRDQSDSSRLVGAHSTGSRAA